MTDYFLIQRNYRSLGKVAWLIIAAAKASGPPLDEWCISQSGDLFFIRCPFYSYTGNEYERVSSKMRSNGISSALSHVDYVFFSFSSFFLLENSLTSTGMRN